MVEDDFLELLVNLLLFAENDITLALDGLGLELGVLEDIGENVDGCGDVVVESLGVVDGVFALSDHQYASCAALYHGLHIPRCRRSNGHPCFLSRAPTAAVCASGFPIAQD